jgi:phosphoribosylaminoimidazolecarboxamide formyltransferase/IMP cyclohydrolase
MTLNVVRDIDDEVRIDTVLISVSDKTGLEDLVTALVSVNPEVRLLSTGGTHGRIADLLGERKAERHLVQVSAYTGQPETQGGLVKTLDFKIYLGILTETYNEDHQGDLKRTDARPIDMVVCNLYPFARAVAKEGVTVEQARTNIDIGGPTMVRAAAKNYLRVASVVDPADYQQIVVKLRENRGRLDLATRFALAQKAFRHTADYDTAIADHLGKLDFESERTSYTIVTEEG